jgi:hypothetical protein
VDRPWALPAAAAVLTLEGAAVLGLLLQHPSTPFGVQLLMAAKFPVCWALARRSRPAFLTLVVWECLVVVVALVNPVLHPFARLGLLASSVFGLTLLGWSLSAFPTPKTRTEP